MFFLGMLSIQCKIRRDRPIAIDLLATPDLAYCLALAVSRFCTIISVNW